MTTFTVGALAHKNPTENNDGNADPNPKPDILPA